MKQTKKPTYKELEKNKDCFVLKVIIFFSIFSILYILFIFEITNTRYTTNELKSQLNKTEGKNYSCDFVGAIKPEDTRICEEEKIEVKEEVDYHSSGKLFCEHYNGTFQAVLWSGYCNIIKEDITNICRVTKGSDNKFSFSETCEVIE